MALQSHPQPSAPPRLALARNVYHTATKVYGQWAWFAVTSQGELLGPYRARRHETDAELVAILARELEQVDPQRRLTLVPAASGPRSTLGALAARTWLLVGGRPRFGQPALWLAGVGLA